jgi:hypothetical protein
MTKLKALRKDSLETKEVMYVLPGYAASGLMSVLVEVRRRGFLVQTGKKEPLNVSDAAMKRLSAWLAKMFSEPGPAPDDQVVVQLAGCLTAAEGYNQRPAKPGDYGYSVAYEKTLLLRRAFEKLAHGKSPQQVLDRK